MIVPSTTITHLRGDEDNPATDVYGDAVDTNTAVRAGIPACITAASRRTYDPVSGRTLVVNGFNVALRPRSGSFEESDRIQDDRTGDIYQVETVSVSPPMLMQEVTTLFCTVVR